MSDYRRNGYKMLYMPSHHRASTDGMVYEHIVLAEKYIGRELEPQEVVHHEDRVRDNNSEENLFVFKTEADHATYHSSGIMIPCGDGSYRSESIVVKSGVSKGRSIKSITCKNCELCSKEFPTHKQSSRFCSHDCSHKATRKTERPLPEELKELIEAEGYSATGRMFGVSDNAVRKWAKSYGII